MSIRELIGKTITNIYAMYGLKDEWLDTAENFIELDGKVIIEMPYGHSKEVYIKKLNPKAETIFNHVERYPVYSISENKEVKLTGYRESNILNIRNAIIKDFLWYDDESEKGLLLLNNGIIISETNMAPNGTGSAGINLYESQEKLINLKGKNFKRLLGEMDLL